MVTSDTAYQKPETSRKEPQENLTFYRSMLKKIQKPNQNKQKELILSYEDSQDELHSCLDN